MISGSPLPANHVLRDGTAVLVRRPTGADADAMLQYLDVVARETPNLTFGPGELGFTLEQERVFLESRSTGDQLVALALHDGHIVSSATIERRMRPRTAHLGVLGISVRQSHWSRGLGQLMMRVLIDWSVDNGLRQLNLEVRTDNARAVRLYAHLGFACLGRCPRTFLVGGEFIETQWMGLALNPPGAERE